MNSLYGTVQKAGLGGREGASADTSVGRQSRCSPAVKGLSAQLLKRAAIWFHRALASVPGGRTNEGGVKGGWVVGWRGVGGGGEGGVRRKDQKHALHRARAEASVAAGIATGRRAKSLSDQHDLPAVAR